MRQIPLSVLKKLFNYHALEMNDKLGDIVNGCGGKGGWCRPIKWFNMTPICNRHDYLYSVGITPQDRKDADIYLLYGILSLGDHMSWWNPKKTYYWIQSYVYYYAVRLFGNKFFGANK